MTPLLHSAAKTVGFKPLSRKATKTLKPYTLEPQTFKPENPKSPKPYLTGQRT